MRHRVLVIILLLGLASISAAENRSVLLSEDGSGITVLETQQNRTVLNLKISEINLEESEVNGSDRYTVRLPDDFENSSGAILGPGNILLPTITRKIAVPFDSDPTIRITRSEYTELNNIALAAATGEDLESYFGPDQSFALGLRQEIVKGEVAGVMRDLRIYSITFAPVQYDPENMKLVIYHDLEIEIEHSGSRITRYNDRISEAFAPIYRSILDNPAVFDPIEVTRGAYWIIYPDAFASQLQPFAEWKSRKGFDIEMIAKSDIGSNPSYVTIKNYIVDRFDSCLVKPDYIAIVGDVTMPSNMGIPTRTYPNIPPDFGDIESDNYYTFIDGNDYFPEIFIGRISIDYAGDLSNYLAKLFSYERTPYMTETDWYLRATVVSGGDDGHFVSPRITKLWCGERMTDVGFTNIDTLFDSWTHPVSSYQVNSSINSGVSYVNYRGYGDAAGWSYPLYTYSHLNNLYNGPKYPIMTSIVCGTGDYNDYLDICFGEAWIRLSGKGGPGFIGNSNHDAHTRWTNALDCGIYWGWFVENVTTLAQGQFMGKIALWNAFPNDRQPNGQVDLYFNSYNILGDPELNCWTGIPKAMTVLHDDSLEFGENLLSIQVYDDFGSPIEGAYVCATNDAEIFLGGFTSEDGSINFEISPDNPGDVYVTVTSRGYIPYEGIANFYNTSMAVGYVSHVVDDDNNGESSGNGNGSLNPSEIIELAVDLRNYGQSDTAAGVTASLTSSSPFISVSRGNANFGDISPGQNGSGDLPYLIEISSDAFNGYTANLFLDISDNGGNSWDAIIQVIFEAAQLEVDSILIIDSGNGQIDPGELVEMQISLTNIGNLVINGASAVLRTTDDQVSIVDSNAVFGDCAPDGSFDNNGDTFMLSVDAGIYVGHLINFTLEFTGGGPQTVSTAFNQIVGTVTTSDPIGPDNYGYYCLDNTDVNYPDHPTYDWIDIDTQNWDWVQPADDDVITIALPFPVSYYGQLYDEVSICDNGHVAMGQSWWNAWFNTPIPAPQNAAAMLAPFWDDLKYSNYSSMGPKVYYHHDDLNSRFIIAYYNAWADDVNRNETFEIVILDRFAWPTLTGDNDIIFQYLDVNNPYSASVGICSPDRRDGIEYLFNNRYADGAASLVDGRAIKFTTGSLYATDIKDNAIVPTGFSLSQSYPNPFNATAIIEFSILESGETTLEVFNLLGQKIEILVDRNLSAGNHSAIWKADNIPSGVYFYRLTAGGFEQTKRMTLLK